MPTQKGMGWNSSWGCQGPTEHSHLLVTEPSPCGLRQWSLLLQAPVCLASALTLLEAVGLPSKFPSGPRLRIACQAGTHVLLPLCRWTDWTPQRVYASKRSMW